MTNHSELDSIRLPPGRQFTIAARRQVRHAIRICALNVLYYSGLLWLLASLRLRRRIVVLTYHRVLPESHQQESFSSPGIIVTPETFDRHMRFLRRHFNPVDLPTFVGLLHGTSVPSPRTCLVTFDDGWHDNLEFALPILTRHRVPAALFVATHYVGEGHGFWQESLSRQLFEARRRPQAAGLLQQLGIGDIGMVTTDRAREAIRKFVDEIKKAPLSAVRELRARLEESAPDDNGSGVDRFLSWDDLTEMKREGLLAIGSHGCTHTPMTRLENEAVRSELEESRRLIESNLGVSVRALAYPNGDTDSEIAETARRQGFHVGFTTRRGLVSRHSDPLQLPRVNIHEGAASSIAAFLYRALGIS